MIPNYIKLEDFDQYLDHLYPPHNIFVSDNEDPPGIDQSETDRIRENLLITAYNELNVAFDLSATPTDISKMAIFLHATHIWRSEGSRSARLDLIAQGVTKAGVVQETYSGDLPFSPYIINALDPFRRSVALQLVQMQRPMDQSWGRWGDNLGSILQ